MSNFINLVWNEQTKIYGRKATWVMIGLLLLVALIGCFIIQFADGTAQKETLGDDWRTELQAQNEQLIEESGDDGFIQMANDPQIRLNQYHLDQDIKPLPLDAWEYTLGNASVSSVVSLFTIIIAAGIIANEFSWGTIKLLLIRPISRSKILMSKYVSVLLFALTLFVLFILSSWVFGALFFGVNGLSPSLIIQAPSGFMQVDALSEIGKEYGLRTVNLIMMATFAFMLSAMFRSSGMAIGVAIFLMMAGNAIIVFLSQYDWAKYILFANTDLSQYSEGAQPVIEGMTLSFSITVLLVYFTLFLGAAWISFSKRDVAGH